MGFRSRQGVKKDNSRYTHRFLNSPNTTRQVCTACGMLKEIIWNKELKKNETYYTSKDGVRTLGPQPCTVESY